MGIVCTSVLIIGLIVGAFLYFQESQQLAEIQQDRRIKEWCDWMRTLDGYDGSFAICRNDEDVRYAENVMSMQYEGTVDGIGKVFVPYGYSAPTTTYPEAISRALKHIARSGKA